MSKSIIRSAGILMVCLGLVGCTHNQSISSSDSSYVEPVTVSSKTNTVVIGGGVSGIAAVLRLRQNGIDTILLEKDRTVGGALLYSAMQQQTVSGIDAGSKDSGWSLLADGLAETVQWQSEDLGLFKIDEEEMPQYVVYEASTPQLLQKEVDVSGASVYTETTASKVVETEDGLVVSAKNSDGTSYEITCDHVIVATGSHIQNQTDGLFAGVLTNTTNTEKLLKQFEVDREDASLLMETHFGYVMDENGFVLDAYDGLVNLSEEEMFLVDGNGSLLQREDRLRSELESQIDTDTVYAVVNEKAYRKFISYVTQEKPNPLKRLLKTEEESYPGITKGSNLFLACEKGGIRENRIVQLIGKVNSQFRGADENCYVIALRKAVYEGVGGIVGNESLQIRDNRIYVVGSCASAFLKEDPSIGNQLAWAFVSGKHAADLISETAE